MARKNCTGKQIKVSNKPQDKGIYYRTDNHGIKTFYIVYQEYGKQKWEKIGSDYEGYTVAMARQTRINRIQAVKAGTAVPTGTMMTLDQGWEKYYNILISDGYASANSEKSHYIRHIQSYLGHKPMHVLIPDDFKTLQQELIENGVGLRHIPLIFGTVRRIYDRMKGLGLYNGTNPVKDLGLKNMQVKRERYLTAVQSEEFLKAARVIDETLYRQCAFALYAGLRSNEVLRLCLDRVDLHNKVLRIPTKHRNRPGKERRVPIRKKLAEILKEILDEKPWKPTEKFFPQGKVDLNRFQQACAKLGLNDGYTPKDRANWFTFHNLRHTFGTLAANYGMPTKRLAAIMGHETTATTERYTHVRDEMLDESMDSMDKAYEQELSRMRHTQIRAVK